MVKFRIALGVFAISLPLLMGCTPNNPGTVNTLALTASPSKPAYKVGERVQFNMMLTNISHAAINVSNVVDGNIHVKTATKDGKAIQPRQTAVDYDSDLGTALAKNVVTVPVGGSVAEMLASKPTSGKKQVLRFVDKSATENIGTLYSVAVPGAYEFAIYYQYGGAATAGLAPFAGESNITTVKFVVSP